MNWNKNKYTHEEFMRMREDAMRQLSEMARRQSQGAAARPQPEKPLTAPAPAEARGGEKPPAPLSALPVDGDALLSTLTGLLGNLASPAAAVQESPESRPGPSGPPESADALPAKTGAAEKEASPAGVPLPEGADKEAAFAEEPGALKAEGLPLQNSSLSSVPSCGQALPFEEMAGPEPPSPGGSSPLDTSKGDIAPAAGPGSPLQDSALSGGRDDPPVRQAEKPEALWPDSVLERFSDQIPRSPASFHPDQFIRAEDEEEFLPEMEFTKKK